MGPIFLLWFAINLKISGVGSGLCRYPNIRQHEELLPMHKDIATANTRSLPSIYSDQYSTCVPIYTTNPIQCHLMGTG